MSRINLILSLQPGMVEVFVNFKDKSGDFDTEVAIIDTGAEQSLFPLKFLEIYEHRIITPKLVIDQAGIAKQGFSAVEAIVILYFEDTEGNKSEKWMFGHGLPIQRKSLLAFRMF